MTAWDKIERVCFVVLFVHKSCSSSSNEKLKGGFFHLKFNLSGNLDFFSFPLSYISYNVRKSSIN